MLQRLRSRVQGQEGFTLIELLVVILIIGILAAVAIPTFLSQTSKAYDSNVESTLNSAHTAAETYYTSNGSYPSALTKKATTAAKNPLISIEQTLQTPWSSDQMTFTPAGADQYTIVANDSKDSINFDLTYDRSTGQVLRTCNKSAKPNLTNVGTIKNQGDCSNTGTWGG